MTLGELARAGYVAARLDGVTFDPGKLRQYFDDVVAERHKIAPYAKYAVWDYWGWSVLSSNGHYTDGFQPAHVDKSIRIDNRDFIVSTILNRGYISQVVAAIEKFMFICRARVMVADPTYKMAYHVDSAPTPSGFWRGHVVLKTQPNAFLRWRRKGTETDFHIPLDGHVYFVRTDVEHRTETQINDTRAHFVFDTVVPITALELPLTPGLKL